MDDGFCFSLEIISLFQLDFSCLHSFCLLTVKCDDSQVILLAQPVPTPEMVCFTKTPLYCRGQGYGFGDDKSGLGGDRRSSDPQDSDSDSELDIEGPSSPDLRDDEINTSGDRDRSRDESGSEEDPLTKTSPTGGGGGGGGNIQGFHPGWPSHPAFSSLAAPGLQSQTLNKITSQFWGFDPSITRPPLPHPPAHPLDSLSLSFPLSFPGLQTSLQSHFFKLPPESEASRQMLRFRSSTWSHFSQSAHFFMPNSFLRNNILSYNQHYLSSTSEHYF